MRHHWIGTWLSLVERCVRDAEVAGSNPVVPIKGLAILAPYARGFSFGVSRLYPSPDEVSPDSFNSGRYLEGLLSIVAQGTEVVLTEGDIPIARLAPIWKRVAGLHTGSIWTSEDFDEPLPDEFWTGNA
jgi:antitoxin (DNA-binding transcriptional repressor) of toxin-antitoxin stability system